MAATLVALLVLAIPSSAFAVTAPTITSKPKTPTNTTTATFKFTGGEIVGEFLLSTGYLPGAHRESCPVYLEVLKKRPRWDHTTVP